MTQKTSLHSTIAAILDTPRAGSAVARALNDHYREWQDRAAIGDLRARRARHDYEDALDRRERDAMSALITYRRHH